MGWYFVFFLLSGFCSILYELVWLRLAMAQFGVTTALVSITLSVFMLGMGIGSWGAGVLTRRFGGRIRQPVRLYALAEFIIGCSSLAVPIELSLGRRMLESMTQQSLWSSGIYYLASGALVAVIVMPWCIFMGATYPLAMAAIRRDVGDEARRSFSFLYVANVVGAVAGAVIPLMFIEVLGFHATLRIGFALNAAIAIAAFSLALRKGKAPLPSLEQSKAGSALVTNPQKGTLVLLFLTGLVTMGMEVIWIRLYTPYLGPIVYSFAAILATYLIATFVGSILYRRARRTGGLASRLKWVSLAFWGLLPLIATDPRLPFSPGHRVEMLAKVWLGIFMFAMVVGYLTPMLIDRWSGGDPDRAGRAYTVNVLGCILGPLLSGFILLPLFGGHLSMLLYATPWMVMAAFPGEAGAGRIKTRLATYAIVIAALIVVFVTKDYETIFAQRRVLRDSTATVIATGTGMDKKLIINGVWVTSLTPITKMMAHFTLASLERPPRNALIICFGMGTTFRSASSWGIQDTVVELVPSVPRLFSFFHSDADRILASPTSRLVIDDGRRFMERSPERFDAIIIDTSPPVQAAESSLLYSEEFYAVAKRHLNDGGILAQWLDWGDDSVRAAVSKALRESFPYVRVFRSVEGWGWHFQASMRPIPVRNAAELVKRMPHGAVVDMMEWGPAKNPADQFQLMLSTESTTDPMIALSPRTPAMHDDLPVNEYFLVRRVMAHAIFRRR